MTIITEDHVEWAVVDRLRKMLQQPPHAEFNVTHTYALFSGVLLWTKNRLYSHEDKSDSAGGEAIKLRKKLNKYNVEDLPWALRTDENANDDHKDFKEEKVNVFIKWLRDSIAHGDGRNIRLWVNNGALVGFNIHGQSLHDVERNASLTEADLRRIGIALADHFCKAVRQGSHPDDSNFGRDAAGCIVEKAA